MRLRFEWRLPDQELVAENSEWPKVDLFVVKASLHHLWRQVVEGATHGCAPWGGCVHAPTEIGNLQVSLHVEQQIFGLDITMNDLAVK